MRGRSNDTIGTLHEGLSGDWQKQVCFCEAAAMTQWEQCTKGFLAIGKNKFDFCRGGSNDTIWNSARGLSGVSQEQAY